MLHPVQDAEPALTRGLTLLLAAACGLMVANLYYAQPLLPELAASFRVSAGVAGLAVVFAQLGYAAGLVFVVSPGDLIAVRPLVVGLLALNAAALTTAAAAPSALVLLAAMALIDLSASAISLLIVFASALAGRDATGAVVGTLMAGLLSGVLLARTIAGAVEGLAGRRAVYAGFAVVVRGFRRRHGGTGAGAAPAAAAHAGHRVDQLPAAARLDRRPDPP